MTFGLLAIIIASSFFAGVLTQRLYAEAQESKAIERNKRATFIAPFQICSGIENPKPSEQYIFLQRKVSYPFIPLGEQLAAPCYQYVINLFKK